VTAGRYDRLAAEAEAAQQALADAWETPGVDGPAARTARQEAAGRLGAAQDEMDAERARHVLLPRLGARDIEREAG